MQHHQALTLLFVGRGGDREDLVGDSRQLVQFFFDLDVRHHLGADLAEADGAVGGSPEQQHVHERQVVADEQCSAFAFGTC
jgi:hypothetical protein